VTAESKPKIPWQAPRWRTVPARDTEMPVGKPGSRSDLGSFS
jgi:hypothetical protein